MIPHDFEAEALYAPEAWFVHDVLEIDVDGGRVVGLIDTTRLGALVDAQRTHPGHHKHLPGAVAIQVTGTLGNLHAVYALGLRPSQGWVGYGTHVREARFRRMGAVGPPVVAELRATRARNLRGTWFVDYAFRFDQEGELVFESRQIAAWGRFSGD